MGERSSGSHSPSSMKAPGEWPTGHLNLLRVPPRIGQEDSPLAQTDNQAVLYRHTSFYCALLYCALQISHFLQIKGKDPPPAKRYDSLSYNNSLLWSSGTKLEICMYLQNTSSEGKSV